MDLAELGLRLDVMILRVFSHLKDSMSLTCRKFRKVKVGRQVVCAVCCTVMVK